MCPYIEVIYGIKYKIVKNVNVKYWSCLHWASVMHEFILQILTSCPLAFKTFCYFSAWILWRFIAIKYDSKKNHTSQIFQCRSCCVILVMLKKLGYSSLPVKSNQIHDLVFHGNSRWRCDWVQVRMDIRFLLLPVVSPAPYFSTFTCAFPTCPNGASQLCQASVLVLLCLSPL